MISVFKTSVSNAIEIEILRPLLETYLETAKWNFDIADCDNILRIDSQKEIVELTINLLHDNGFDCEELAD